MSQSLESAGEEVLWSGSVSHWHYAGKWFLVLLLTAALVVSFIFPLQEQWLDAWGLHRFGFTDTAVWSVRGLLFLLALVLIVWIRMARAGRKYLVTSKRVAIEFGLVSKTSNEIRIDHIRSINLVKKGLLGFLGVGRLEFSSAATDDAEVIFWNVARVERIRDLVRATEKTA